MGRIIVFNNVALDGVMQAPGRPDEDRRGGFQYDGWAMLYSDPAIGKAAGESMATTAGLLLGRRTYEDFYAFWPKQTDNNPFTEVLNNTQKYVASRTLKEPLSWMNSTLISGDVPQAVAELKKGLDKDLVVLGSGKRLFPDGRRVNLKLIESQTLPTGVLFQQYQPAR